MNILLTGNLGYVGSVMSAFLQRAGHRVRGYDVGYFAPCKLETPPAPDEQAIGDVRAFDPGALKGIDAVVHLAALSNDPLGELDPEITTDINGGGTRMVARAARDAGIARFVYASSCSLYGLSDATVALDENAPTNPLTAYARSKIAGEAILTELAGARFRPIALRFATAYGWSARLRLDLVVNNLVASALGRGVIALESDGTPWRPLVHVQDMALAVACALDADLDRFGAQAYNAGTESENYQVIQIAEHVAAATGAPITKGPPGADQRSYNVSFAKIRRDFPAFEPRWNLARGIEDLVSRLRAGGNEHAIDADTCFRIRRIRSLMSSGAIDARLAPRAAALVP